MAPANTKLVNVVETTVDDVLWGADTQRAIMGMLVEKLGGSARFTLEDIAASPTASGHRQLWAAIDQEAGITLEVKLNILAN